MNKDLNKEKKKLQVSVVDATDPGRMIIQLLKQKGISTEHLIHNTSLFTEKQYPLTLYSGFRIMNFR